MGQTSTKQRKEDSSRNAELQKVDTGPWIRLNNIPFHRNGEPQWKLHLSIQQVNDHVFMYYEVSDRWEGEYGKFLIINKYDTITDNWTKDCCMLPEGSYLEWRAVVDPRNECCAY